MSEAVSHPEAGIYAIHGPAGCYVGETQNLEARKRAHRRTLTMVRDLLGSEGTLKFEVVQRMPGSSKLDRMAQEHAHAECLRAAGVKVVSRTSPGRPRKHPEIQKTEVRERQKERLAKDGLDIYLK